MSLFKKKKILVTHNGTFHTDDLFATATLSILNKGNIKIIRTRDPKMFEKGDYVYDVGGEYNVDKKMFDHHQKEGSGKRENGIPYASFGLVWKTYGEEICGSKEVAEIIDRKIACSIDAHDNGVDILKPIFKDVFPYVADQVFLVYKPTWKEKNKDIDVIFSEQVKKVEKILLREIEVTKADVEGKNIILNAYNNSKDKKIIILNDDFPRYLYQDTLSRLPEPIYAVIPSGHSDLWKVEAIKKSPETMENRKLFPESWRGFFVGDNKIKEVTGVTDASFSHKAGFLMIAESKEGAIKLAEKALLG
jgi:uncharacterized UPF0160 family protein